MGYDLYPKNLEGFLFVKLNIQFLDKFLYKLVVACLIRHTGPGMVCTGEKVNFLVAVLGMFVIDFGMLFVDEGIGVSMNK